ncbi:hypothetical protein K1T71_001335 [Dendrolimus kikuchii]|uniref:Uncharacterized protein n=1 Tax=Dendrolimus kikuchii TaxID=765133 RepID=A0ACC1DHC2_9NEOP|nr:hypothetical protein K1T71_001335 [Dendrolimus kikuchii]
MKRLNLIIKISNMKVLIILFIISTSLVKCNSKDSAKSSKNPLLYFRKQVEEIEDTTINNNGHDESRSNLVSFLIKNVKEIFDGLSTSETTEAVQIFTNPTKTTSIVKIDTHIESENKISTNLTLTNDVMMYENLTITTLLVDDRRGHNEELYGITGRSQLLHLSKDLMYFEKPDSHARDNISPALYKSIKMNNVEDTSEDNETSERRRSCIVCDNVNSEECNDPKNKLISSTVCDREDDLCYSQHTPFGIVDRGCFNINHNMSTYVCACNLCNYISISELPYIFSNKRDWVDNVIELSRTRNFRKSVFKDMSCLRCEVNVTTKTGDMLDSANCLEGNVGTLPIEECNDNEVCAVKVVRSDGYVWRGCVKTPLYNYWWALCDSDLCNYDALISIYDHL